MAERKVASRQERLMFEQLIRQDMQNGIQRTISNSQTPNSYNPNNNQNQIRTPNSNNMNQNYPQMQSPKQQTPQNINQNKYINNGPKRTLAQKFNIRTNKGKRDMVWEQKRQIKFAKYEQLMQEEQQYYEQQLSPKMTPSNYNNPQQVQRGTPNNRQRMSPNQQQYINEQNYQRNTPSNQQRMSPNQQRMSPNQQRMSPYQQRMSPNQQMMSPNQQYYQRDISNNGQRMALQEEYQRRTPVNQNEMDRGQEYQIVSPNNGQRMTPQQQYQYQNGDPQQYQRNSPNYNQRMSPQEYQNQNMRPPLNNPRGSPQYQNGNNTPYNLNQRMSPQQQYQRNNNIPYNNIDNMNNRQSPNNYNNRNSPYDYNQGRQSPYNEYPLRTPQPQFNPSRSPIQNHYDNYNNNLKGSRTPFVDYKTGQNIYNQRGFTPSQNQYNDIPNRPPSRPFGEISFKGQPNGAENMGGRGYSKHNYSNANNYY